MAATLFIYIGCGTVTTFSATQGFGRWATHKMGAAGRQGTGCCCSCCCDGTCAAILNMHATYSPVQTESLLPAACDCQPPCIRRTLKWGKGRLLSTCELVSTPALQAPACLPAAGCCRGFQIESATDRATNNTQADVARISNNILTNPSWGIISAFAFGLAITGQGVLSGVCPSLVGKRPVPACRGTARQTLLAAGRVS